jgi:Fe2+ or Zn2+ uptake regulation protein
MTEGAVLRTAGIRPTAGRLRIFSIFERSQRPLTVDEVRARCRGLDKVTVYRTVESFVAAGLLVPVVLGSGKAYYERVREHHHHIVCTDCGSIEDVHIPHRGMERAALAHSKRFDRITRHSLEFFGTCGRCAAAV